MPGQRTLTLTHLGHPITACESATWDKPSQQPRVLFIGGVHGDEPEGVALATRAQDYLSLKESKLNWSLIPCLNPDGYFTHPRRRTNGRAVDLNRNFPSRDWSSETKAPRYFPGPHPNSELETQALVQYISDHQPDLIVHFHSYKEACIVYTGSSAKTCAELFASSSGSGAREDIGYPTPGSLGQYGWYDCQIPVICIEELEGVPLESIWPRFQSAFEKLLAAPNDYIVRRSRAV